MGKKLEIQMIPQSKQYKDNWDAVFGGDPKPNDFDDGVRLTPPEVLQQKISAEAADRINAATPRPIPKKYIDVTKIIAHTKSILDHLEKEGNPGKDADHYLFETVMEEIYGTDVWKWYNEKYY